MVLVTKDLVGLLLHFTKKAADFLVVSNFKMVDLKDLNSLVITRPTVLQTNLKIINCTISGG